MTAQFARLLKKELTLQIETTVKLAFFEHTSQLHISAVSVPSTGTEGRNVALKHH